MENKPGRLGGKVALVTGASRGIGRATAIRLAEEGAKITVNYCQNKIAGEKVVNQIRKNGGEAILVQGDVSVSKEADYLVEKTVKAFGRLDILVNNAGIDGKSHNPLEISDEQWRLVMGVNLDGAFYCARAAVRVMKEQGYGNIVNVSSMGGIDPHAAIEYSTSKGALIMLTRCLAKHLGHWDIRVNAVAPGFTETDIHREKFARAGVRRQAEEMSVLKRIADPKEVAAAIAYLVSSEADFVTGTVLNISGGAVI